VTSFPRGHPAVKRDKDKDEDPRDEEAYRINPVAPERKCLPDHKQISKNRGVAVFF
jgi:hypothetical protein